MRFHKRPAGLTCLLLVALTLCFAVCGCSHSVTEQGNRYLDERTGIAYIYAGFDWMPVTVGKHFADIATGKTTYPLYAVENVPTEQWLCSADGDLFCGESVTMPTLETFAPDGMTVCQIVNYKEKTLEAIDDAAIVASVTDLFLRGVSLPDPEVRHSDRFELYFTSAQYPGIRYHLLLLVYEEPILYTSEQGFTYETNVLLYSRELNRYVVADEGFATYAE